MSRPAAPPIPHHLQDDGDAVDETQLRVYNVDYQMSLRLRLSRLSVS